MAVWALLDDGNKVAVWRGPCDKLCREYCEADALALALAAKTKKGVALGPGVAIVCLPED